MSQDIAKAVRTAKLVSSYMTPFAVLLVTLAAFALGWNLVTQVAVGIVAFTTLVNVVLVSMIGRFPARFMLIRNSRAVFNYAFNIVLICLLFDRWSPIWMLFLVTIIAVAVYDTRKSTMWIAGMFSAVLFAILYFKHFSSRPVVAETLMYIASIWILGLFVNHLVSTRSAS